LKRISGRLDFLRIRPTTGVLIFLAVFFIYLFCLNSVWAVDHATSFLELDYAMWARHSFVLGSGFNSGSVDDFRYDGNYYSALAPGTAILALPFVGVGFILDGHFTVFGYATLFSEVFVALANSVAASLVYLLARFFFEKRVSAFLGFAYAFSTISWPFATYFFQSDVSALFCLLAVYLTIHLTRYEDKRTTYSALAGAAVCVAMVVDYIDAVFLPIILLYVFLILREKKVQLAKPSLAVLSTALIGIALIGLYNYVNFGSPLRGTEQLYLHASSVFSEFSYPIYLGAYLNLLSPYRGLLVYCVFLVVGIFGLYDMLRYSPFRREAVLLLASFLGIFIPYSMWYDPSGGEAFGPRFLVAAIPFLLIPAGMIVKSKDRRMGVLVFVLYAAGVIMNGIAGVTEAVTPSLSYSTSPFFAWTLPQFLKGSLDTWWLKYAGGDWELPSVLIIAAAMVIPIISNHFLADKDEVPGLQGAEKPESVADLGTRS
jgi:hypothetical protein